MPATSASGEPGLPRPLPGVGPAQLTWFSFQDRADDLGGCPHPFWNMLVGFEIIKAHVDGGASIWNAYKGYNGAGAYATEPYAGATSGSVG